VQKIGAAPVQTAAAADAGGMRPYHAVAAGFRKCKRRPFYAISKPHPSSQTGLRKKYIETMMTTPKRTARFLQGIPVLSSSGAAQCSLANNPLSMLPVL